MESADTDLCAPADTHFDIGRIPELAVQASPLGAGCLILVDITE